MTPKKFNYKSLVIARESAGVTQKRLAVELDIDQGNLSKIEQGLRDVPEDLLNKISDKLEFPIEFFYEPIDAYSISTIYFRKHRSLPARYFTQFKSYLEIRRFHIEKLLSSVDVDLNLEYIEPDMERITPEEIARHYRYTWKVPEGRIDNLVDIIENNGIIILKIPFNHTKLDGLTFFTSNSYPIIYLNYNQPADRLNFSLAHELGHLIMHLNFRPNSDRNVELEAHRFASEFLMPEREIKPFLKIRSIEQLADLKKMWNVSMAALLYRAYELKVITENQFKYMNIKLVKAGYKKLEPLLGLIKHEPTLLNELLGDYLGTLNYTKDDLAQLLKVKNHYLYNHYFSPDGSFKVVA